MTKFYSVCGIQSGNPALSIDGWLKMAKAADRSKRAELARVDLAAEVISATAAALERHDRAL